VLLRASDATNATSYTVRRHQAGESVLAHAHGHFVTTGHMTTELVPCTRRRYSGSTLVGGTKHYLIFVGSKYSKHAGRFEEK